MQRQIVLASMGNSDGEEEQVAHPEARASRRKYRAERRARILQLFGPVSMVLREEHFHRQHQPEQKGDDSDVPVEESKSPIECPITETEADEKRSASSETDLDVEEGKAPLGEMVSFDEDLYADESDFVEIPSGVNGSGTRLVPCLCVICLQKYEVGEEIVWASNPDCDHVFHESCIERWLIKQRGGPLCPCCRRDFVIDPFDLETSHDEEEANSPFE